ncbi:uncharacterized protein LOC121856076 [Homarus americanus]|uniref:uncharacterized protein LOC121856076 n=1 Tax=Homarus americanus TaxID=6706 RepID=UPI001C4626EA|nr:uncharacterized protein LOC121856076 [Homarus americanus]
MKMLVPLLLTSALLVVAVTASRRDCPPGPFPPNFKTNMKKCLCDDEGIDEEACKTKVNQIKDSFKTCVTSIIDEFDLTVESTGKPIPSAVFQCVANKEEEFGICLDKFKQHKRGQ